MTVMNLMWITSVIAITLASPFAQALQIDEYNPALSRRHLLDFPLKTQGPISVAFFDADSTLRVSKSGLPWATNEDDFVVLNNVAKKLRDLNNRGYLIAIVSNQGRIPESISLNEADHAFRNLISELKAKGAVVNYFDFADQLGADRKPNIGMFQRLDRVLQKTFGPQSRIDLNSSFMVGDAAYKSTDFRNDGLIGRDFSHADRKFAENAGIMFFEPDHFFGWSKLGISRIPNRFINQKLSIRRNVCPTAFLGLSNP